MCTRLLSFADNFYCQFLTNSSRIFPKEIRTNEIKNERDETKKWEEIIERNDLKIRNKKYIYDFQ